MIMAGQATIDQGIERRKKIMIFLRSYAKKNGFSPSVVEIAEAVGLSSKSAATHHLLILADEGKISMKDGKYRSIKVL